MKKKKKLDEELEQEQEELDETVDYEEVEEDDEVKEKKMKINVNDFNEVGHNVVSQTLALYRSNKYFREKEFMAKKLLEVGYEAGRNVSRVAISKECAMEAKRSLDELTFLIDSMIWDSIYTKHRVSKTVEAIELANRLLNKVVYAGQSADAYETVNYVETNTDGFNDDYYDV